MFEVVARNPTLAAAQARLLIDQLLAEPLLDSATADDLLENLVDGDSSYANQLFNRSTPELVMQLAPEDRFKIAAQFDRIISRYELGIARKRADLEKLRSEAALLQAGDYKKRATEAEQLLGRTDVAWQVTERLRELAVGATVSATVPAVPPAAPEEPLRAPPKGKKKPLWSFVEREFLAEKTRVVEGHREYDHQTVRQTEATMHLWTASLGDRPVDQYDGSDAGTFRDLMLRMPSSHGKGGTRAQTRRTVPPLEAIRLVDERQKAIDARNALLPEGALREPDIKRLTMKTLKRHFSSLSQLWVYAARRDYVPRGTNPFRGWEYQGVNTGKSASKKKRGPWSVDDLTTLLKSPWFEADKIGSDDWWVTLTAMFSGARVEEIIRLRPAYDIQIIEGVLTISIQDHAAPDKWSPKSEAGARFVPVHSALLERGFEDLVQRRRADGSKRLFPSYKSRPSSPKLSGHFVSSFSRHKIGLGIGPATVFHSFRHSISTILRNTKLSDARESWIDAILGHEGGEDDDGRRRIRSEGVTTYLDDIGIQNLRATVEAIRYPESVMEVLAQVAPASRV